MAKKILNLCAKHPVFDGRVYDKISKTLINKNFEVHNTSPNVETHITVDNIHIHGFKQKHGIIFRVISLYRLLIICKNINPDFILAHEPDALLLGYIYKKLTRSHSKLYFDCHEAYENWYTNKTPFKFYNSLLNSLTIRIIYYIVKRIDGVTSVNQTMTDNFKRINANSYFLPSVSSDFYSIKQYNNGRYLNSSVFFGQYGNSKQQEIFLNAASILKEKGISHKIIIIGGERPDIKYQIPFTTKVSELKLNDYFEFHGWLDKLDAFELIRKYPIGIMRFDSYTMPGNYAMPNKVFEYLSNGLAILGCELNKEIAYLVNEEKCGLLIPDETGESLAKALIFINQNPDEIKNRGINGLNAYKKKYNWENYGKILENIINRQ